MGVSEGMAKTRKTKIKPFAWADLGVNAAEAKRLEEAGLMPHQAARMVTVPLPDLPEYPLPRDEAGELRCEPFSEHSLRRCFEGDPKDAAELLVQGKLPGKLLVLPEEALERLGRSFLRSHGAWIYGEPQDIRCPEWEQARRALGLPTRRPCWTGTIAGAFMRGFVTVEMAFFLADGHAPEAFKGLQESRQAAEGTLRVAKSRAEELVLVAESQAKKLVDEAKRKVEEIRSTAALDLTEVVFGKNQAWRELLESEVLRAARVRFRLVSGADHYQVLFDQDRDWIEVERSRDASSWAFSWNELEDQEVDEAFADDLAEALAKFDRYGMQSVSEHEPPLGAMLLQFRARSALERLQSPLGEEQQLVLHL